VLNAIGNINYEVHVTVYTLSLYLPLILLELNKSDHFERSEVDLV